MIPALGDENAAMNDNLLVATVVLRLLEEFDGANIDARLPPSQLTRECVVSVMGSDLQGHLIGTQSFIRAYDLNPIDQGLRQAAYWAGLRQEIYIALALQRPPNIKPRSRRLLVEEPSLVPADDCTWACRAVLHCADVLDYAFGGDEQPSSTMMVHKRLVEYNQMWRDSRPASFDAYFTDFRVGSKAFPDVRFHADWHGMKSLPSPPSFMYSRLQC